jgi:3-oxoacyl-[acyl-carrier-protein] synthase II
VSRPARIAVTGAGIVSALGSSQEEFWRAVTRGEHGIRQLDLFDPEGCGSGIAAQAPDPFPPDLPRSRTLSRADSFCLQAAREALRQAGLEPGRDLERFGVALGCCTAGMLEAEPVFARACERGWGRVPLASLLRVPIHSSADAIAEMGGCRGPRLSNMTACASGALAIGLAADRIRSGDAEGMIAGGGDSLCRLTYSGFHSLRLLSPEPCRPFDRQRQGLTLGEGAGIVILEPWERALERGVRPLAEFLEYGVSCDAHHMTASHPQGRGALVAMGEALRRAGAAPEDVDYINAHGTGTRSNDDAETQAILSLFARQLGRVRVSSTKSLLGHLLGGAGGVEAVATVLALRHQTVPPTLGLAEPEGEGRIDFVAGPARPMPIRVAMSNSFGFGGANASLVFGRGGDA